MSKVRYLTIARVSLELVEKLSDQENAQFNRIIFSCFQQLENGQKPIYEETDSPFLNMALREAAAELETGYKNYLQKINAKKGSSPDSSSAENRRSIADLPPMNQRSTADQPETDNRREEKREEKNGSEANGEEGMQGGGRFSASEQAQLNNDLSQAGISPDPAFWSLARKAGYAITHRAIRQVMDEDSDSLKYVVKIIMNELKGVMQ